MIYSWRKDDLEEKQTIRMEYEEAPVVEASSVVSFAIDHSLKQRNNSYENGVCVLWD